MPHITDMELQSLRHLVGEESLALAKTRAYAQQCDDPQAKQLIEDCVNQHQRRAQALLEYLQ